MNLNNVFYLNASHDRAYVMAHRQALPKTGITVFGSQLHTHLRGVRILTRHFRDDIELPELNRDDYYSHHYQEIRYLRRQVKVYPVI